MMRKFYIFIFLLIAAFALQAQDRAIPNGYYDNAAGKTGDELKAALHDIIDNHTTITYANIWGAFQSTDLKSNGKIWDMYSDIPNGTPPYEYTYGQHQCGNYDSEGDCYNREHSWPKSWFTGDENSVPGRDLHHIFPTDGYVNQQRSDNPFGEVNTNISYTTFQNGSKLGTCKSSLGYSGTVFEPIDAYKGDFARAYFYMSVRYYGEDSNWNSSNMTTKSELKPWALEMLLRWNEEDPVSQKEIDRNNVIYSNYQHNRNPFIDHPEYANMIWDPNWSATYQIAVAANPVAGGNVSMVATVSDNASIDFSQQGYSNGQVISNATLDSNVGVTFNKGTNNNNSPIYYTGGTAIRCYAGNYFTVSTTTGSISKIVLTYGDSDGSNTITTNVGSFNTNTWTGNSSSVKFTIGGTSGNRRIKGIEVTYSYQGAPASQATCANGASATFTATPNTGWHFVNWTKGTTVVSTNASFNLTVNESATYQANFEINTYDIAVATNNTTYGTAYIGEGPQTVSIDLSNQGFSNEQDLNGTNINIDANVKVVFSTNTGTNAPKYYTNGTAVRCYGGNNFVVSTTSGAITKIKLTYGGSDGSNTITTNVGSFSTPNWTGSASSVTFTIGGTSGNRRIKGIEVTYSGVTQATFDYGATATITATPKSGYSFVNWTVNDNHFSADATCDITVGGATNYVANFTTNSVAANTSVELQALTLAENVTFVVNSGATLTVTGDITQASGSTIEIEDGGQLIVPDNATVAATVKKTTTASTAKGTNNWYIISSPVNNIAVESVAQGIYNMYYYNEPDNMWMNDKVGDDPSNLTVQFANLTNGRGYLYRSSVAGVEFAGNVNSSSVTVPLTRKNTNDILKGFNLIGNPFPHDIYKNDEYKPSGDLPAINNANLTVGYYKLETDGTWVGTYGYNNPIKPGEAFLVKATSSAPADFNVTIANTNNPAASYTPAKSGFNNIMFTVTNSKYTDVAYAMFSEGSGLDKIEHYNKDVQMLYISQNDTDYAIAMMDENTKVISLGFKPMSMAQYTLSLKPDGNFSYLHLIDKITGEDVDMLVEDCYTFIGAPNDIENRFMVRLRFSGTAVDSDIFAYQNGSDIIVEGDGTLQIFDMTGRIITTQRVNGVEPVCTSSLPAGVYIFRLAGESVKTQKIVVK